jgi:prevent-host-death family protein
MKTWQLQDAKARFSDVVDSAINEGPQLITRRGVEKAVIVSMEEWQRILARRADALANEEERRRRVQEFLQSAPPFDVPDRHPRRKRKASPKHVSA